MSHVTAVRDRDVRPSVAPEHQCGARTHLRVLPGRGGRRELVCTLPAKHILDQDTRHGAGVPHGRGKQQRMAFRWEW